MKKKKEERRRRRRHDDKKKRWPSCRSLSLSLSPTFYFNHYFAPLWLFFLQKFIPLPFLKIQKVWQTSLLSLPYKSTVILSFHQTKIFFIANWARVGFNERVEKEFISCTLKLFVWSLNLWVECPNKPNCIQDGNCTLNLEFFGVCRDNYFSSIHQFPSFLL